jgi:hypothetical protein
MNHLQVKAGAEQEAFHLPQPGLFADLDQGSACVGLSDEFRELPGTTQLRILDDWQRGLEQERRRALASLFRDLTASIDDVGLPNKLNQFRQACVRMNIECPADLAILLQQV